MGRSPHASSLTSSPSSLRRRWILISLTALALSLFLQFYSSPRVSGSSSYHQEKSQCKYNESHHDATTSSTASLFYLQTISGSNHPRLRMGVSRGVRDGRDPSTEFFRFDSYPRHSQEFRSSSMILSNQTK